MDKIICKTCGKEFEPRKQWRRESKYCSRRCFKLGFRGEGNPFFGKKCTPEHKQAISGENNGIWKGGKYKSRGYIMVLRKNHPYANSYGYIREHRLIIEQQIGRYLLSSEEVHHLGKKDDNRLCLLMAFANHTSHLKFEQGKSVNSSDIIFDGRGLTV